MSKYIFDFETTNKNPTNAEIVGLGFKKVDANGVETNYASLIKPNLPEGTGVYGWEGEAEKAAAIHKIKRSDAVMFGDDPKTVIKALDEFFDDKGTIEGFNSDSYDMPILRKFLNRHVGGDGHAESVLNKLESYSQVDTMNDAISARGIQGTGVNTLGRFREMMKFNPVVKVDENSNYGKYLKNNPNKMIAHDAMADVETTKELRNVLDNIKTNSGDVEKLLSHESTFNFLVNETSGNINESLIDKIGNSKGKHAERFKVARAFENDTEYYENNIKLLSNPKESIKNYLNEDRLSDTQKADVVKRINSNAGSEVNEVFDTDFYNEIDKYNKKPTEQPKTERLYNQSEVDKIKEEAKKIAEEKTNKIKDGLERDGETMERGYKFLKKMAPVAVAVTGIAVVSSVIRHHEEEKREKFNQFDRYANSGSNSYTKI